MNWSEALFLEMLLLPVTRGLALLPALSSPAGGHSLGGYAVSSVMLNYLVSDATPTRKVKH